MRRKKPFDMKRLFQRTWRKSVIRPYDELKPAVPKLKHNPRLKRCIARMKMTLLPAKIKDGKILEYPRVVNPIIETSPFFDTLRRTEQEKVIEHEIAHLIMAAAMPKYRQIHRHGSVFSFQKVIMRAGELKKGKRRKC